MNFRTPSSSTGTRWTRWCRTATRRRMIVILCIFFSWILFMMLYLIRARTLPSRDACQVLEDITPKRAQSRLPKIVHQLWPKNREMSPHVKRWFNRWNELFPDVEHRLWSDQDIRELIERDFPWFIPTFDSYPANIMRVDSARTFILYSFGGLYADMDYEPLVNFWDRLPDDAPSLIESFWSHELYQNSFMASPPRHEYWNYTWELMLKRAQQIKVKRRAHVLYLTGPTIIDAAFHQYSRDHPGSQLHVLSCQNWHRVSTGYQEQIKEIITRTWEYYFRRTFKPCGSIYDMRCQLGIHHSTTMWHKD